MIQLLIAWLMIKLDGADVPLIFRAIQEGWMISGDEVGSVRSMAR